MNGIAWASLLMTGQTRVTVLRMLTYFDLSSSISGIDLTDCNALVVRSKR